MINQFSSWSLIYNYPFEILYHLKKMRERERKKGGEKERENRDEKLKTKRHVKESKYVFYVQSTKIIFGEPKIQNNCGATKSLIYPIL